MRKAQDTQIKHQRLKVEWSGFFFLFYHGRTHYKTLKSISKVLEETVTVQLTSHRSCSQSNSQLRHTLQKHFGIKLQNAEVVEITHFCQNHLYKLPPSKLWTRILCPCPGGSRWLVTLPLQWQQLGWKSNPGPCWGSLVVYSSFSCHRPQLQHSISALLEVCEGSRNAALPSWITLQLMAC